jgi:NADH-quinone oxidoreductase subunit D
MPGVQELTVSTGPLAPADVTLTLGPQHPSSHGVLRLALALDGDRIARAEPLVGHLHRGAEKLLEVRDYRQGMALANRHDWHGAFAGELGIALAVERLLGLDVPERAVWLRTLVAELTRVQSHLLFLGAFPRHDADQSTARRAWRTREHLVAVLEEASGSRLHLMLTSVGGLRQAPPEGWSDRVRTAVAAVRAALPAITGAVVGAEAVRAQTRGVGVLTAEQVAQYGVSGPPARASGVPLDLRLDEPYLAYAALSAAGILRRVTRTEGDVLARLEVLDEQTVVALDVVDACLDRLAELPAGPVDVRLPKVLRAPEGAVYAWTESPLGISGCYLVSRGDKAPWRLKLRTPSFSNVQVLREVLVGQRLDDLVAVLASLCYVVGDIDK